MSETFTTPTTCSCGAAIAPGRRWPMCPACRAKATTKAKADAEKAKADDRPRCWRCHGAKAVHGHLMCAACLSRWR